MEPSKRGIAKSVNDKESADCIENQVNPQICSVLLELLDLIVKKRLGVRQLKYLPKIRENSGLLFYQLVNKLSVELNVPKSTVRWNLSKLRDSGMITAGNKDAKGIPVKLTEKGEIALQVMEGKIRVLEQK